MPKAAREPIQFAPMLDIRDNWQCHSEVGLSWYFQMLKDMGLESVVFTCVRPGSLLFQKLLEACQFHQLRPEFYVPVNDALSFGLDSLLEYSTVHWHFSVRGPVSVALVQWLQDSPQLKSRCDFVLNLKKDWHFEILLRSWPAFLQDSFYVDIPDSMQDSDHCLNDVERKKLLQWLKREFPWVLFRSFCPDLDWRSHTVHFNISHWNSMETENDEAPDVSFISKELLDTTQYDFFESLEKQGLSYEVLMPFYSGDKPVHLRGHRYFGIQRTQANLKTNSTVVLNYLASQARGPRLEFIDSSLFKKREESFKEDFVLEKQKLKLSRDAFFKVGGLDPAILDGPLVFFDWSWRRQRAEGQKEELDFAKQPEPHDFLDWRQKVEVRNINNKSVFDNWHRVESGQKQSVEGIFKYNQIDYQAHGTQKLIKYLVSHFIYLFYKWGDIIRLVTLLRLIPRVDQIFSRVRSVFQALYGWLYYFSFPIRKIYYFSRYQYQTRIVRLKKRLKVGAEP